jgi:hypothetical protein
VTGDTGSWRLRKARAGETASYDPESAVIVPSPRRNSPPAPEVFRSRLFYKRKGMLEWFGGFGKVCGMFMGILHLASHATPVYDPPQGAAHEHTIARRADDL